MFRVYNYHFDEHPTFDDTFRARVLAQMPKGRRHHISTLKNPEDRDRSIAAYLLLVYGLFEDFHIDHWPDLTIDHNGQPHFAEELTYEGKPLHFSITHTQNTTAVIIADAPCGIDLQPVRYGLRAEQMRKRVTQRFIDEEHRRMIEGSSDPQRAFTRYFTLKEAMAKKNGTSLIHELNLKN